jgi:aspartate-semialdehyde dehydrogenase
VNPERLRHAPNIAIVGSSSPLGKELRDTLEGSDFPAGKIALLETEEYVGLLQEFAGEIQITQILSPEAFSDTDIAFFACSPDIMRAYASTGSPFPERTIDLTQTDRPGILFLNGVSDPALLRGAEYCLNPHPAAIALGRVLARILAVFPVESVAVTLLDPASERGAAGVDELQEQTVGLLNFQGVESKTFSGQLAFNLLAEIPTARRTEELIRRQLATVFGPGLPPIGVVAIQAPVFHSQAFSVFLKLKESPSLGQLADSLRGATNGVTVHAEDGLSPSPVTVVGSDAVHVVRLAVDSEVSGSCFLWIVADNLRLAASNALRIAESLMLAPVRG